MTDAEAAVVAAADNYVAAIDSDEDAYDALAVAVEAWRRTRDAAAAYYATDAAWIDP